MSDSSFIIGDIHGQSERLARLLVEAGLVDERLNWAAGTAALFFTGDFFDRGPDGIGALKLVMRLQQQAELDGGHVGALLGNHEVLLLSVLHFGEQIVAEAGHSFRTIWQLNGGRARDLAQLNERHVDWIASLPALAHVGDALLAHADATFYSAYGSSSAEINQQIAQLLQSCDQQAWITLLDQFSQRLAFDDRLPDGSERAAAFLQLLGGRQIVHGHTPISYMLRRPPELVVDPLVYANGLCVNVDGGMYLGGPGFVYQLPVETAVQR